VLGPVSGCHVNPAVTFGALITRRIPLVEAAGYWVAQFAGGILGALLLWGCSAPRRCTAGRRRGWANGWGPLSDIHIGAGGAFLTEVVLSQVWLFIVAPLVGGAIAAGLHWLVYPRLPGSVDPEQAASPAATAR